MLRIGLCDDIADARLLLEDALERALETTAGRRSFSSFRPAKGCSTGTRSILASSISFFSTWK